jgi:SAM-dependent MidA family methyltransferase
MSEGMSTLLDKLNSVKELPFRDFMELALYDGREGYYARPDLRIGKGGDFVTSEAISPVFGFALARLATEFLASAGDGLTAIVDIGAAQGGLIGSVGAELPGELRSRARLIGVEKMPRKPIDGTELVQTIEEVPADLPALVLSNELFDAFPVARLVMRSEGLRELWVSVEPDGELSWLEKDAPTEYSEYFSRRGIELVEGQFADVSLEWEMFYERVCRRFARALIVTIDYGFRQRQLFDRRVRKFGTVAAFYRHQVHRDVLARPGLQDLTAHINFDDLQGAGERSGFSTLFFGRQAHFLLTLGVTEHPLFRPSHELQPASLAEAVEEAEERRAARRLVLPEGIGEEMKVLVQGRGLPLEGWSFQRKIF